MKAKIGCKLKSFCLFYLKKACEKIELIKVVFIVLISKPTNVQNNILHFCGNINLKKYVQWGHQTVDRRYRIRHCTPMFIGTPCI